MGCKSGELCGQLHVRDEINYNYYCSTIIFRICTFDIYVNFCNLIREKHKSFPVFFSLKQNQMHAFLL